MSRLVRGVEILAAIEASGQRASEIGIDAALAELGVDEAQLRIACTRDARDWINHLPVNATIGDVIGLLASAEMVGVTAGIRLGRMYSADPPD